MDQLEDSSFGRKCIIIKTH